MLIGVGRIVLDFYNNEKASAKRTMLTELCAELRKKFNISCLEIASFDDPERCVIGFSAVVPENWRTRSAQELVERICKTIDEISPARVTVEDWDLLEHGGEK